MRKLRSWSIATSLTFATCLKMASALTPAATLASLYSMQTSTSLPFPTATLTSSDATEFVSSSWSLSKGRLQNGDDNLAFVADPFPNNPVPGAAGNNGNNNTAPVLQATYEAGSFSNNTGGAQFVNLWNASAGSEFQTMILSYEVAFDSGFNWVKGGKLPGIRGGSDINGCSGGDKPNGTDCFSTRLMWRTNGAGEVYAYIPTPNDLCDDSGIICNPDFGTSIQRGSFSFASGQWNRVTLLVSLNNPTNEANGLVSLYFNDVEALSQDNLQLRSGSAVTATGMFFSTFFGGDDSSWATPTTTHTYYRNMQLWANSMASNLTGDAVKASGSLPTRANTLHLLGIFAFTFLFVGAFNI